MVQNYDGYRVEYLVLGETVPRVMHIPKVDLDYWDTAKHVREEVEIQVQWEEVLNMDDILEKWQDAKDDRDLYV